MDTNEIGIVLLLIQDLLHAFGLKVALSSEMKSHGKVLWSIR
jgi:hypothetical protein